MKETWGKVLNATASVIFPFLLGAVLIAALGYKPTEAYVQLFKGAFISKLGLGTTIEKFCPIFLTGVAFCITIQTKYFNTGVEGCLYMGALMAAGAGFIGGMPSFIHIPFCILCGMLAGMVWAAIPGYLKAYHNVNETCVCIMFNYIATLLSTYMIVNPWKGTNAVMCTKPILETAQLPHIFPPSRTNTGIFLTLVIFLFAYWLINKSRFGFKLRSTGANRLFADYVGFDTKRTVLLATCFAGAIGGLAGSIEIIGVYYVVWDNFSANIAFDGLLASVIAKNDIRKLPFSALMLAALKSGALGMERYTDIPKSLIDTLIPLLVILLTMEGAFSLSSHIRTWITKRNLKRPSVVSGKEA